MTILLNLECLAVIRPARAVHFMQHNYIEQQPGEIGDVRNVFASLQCNTVTSGKRHSIPNQRQIDCSFKRLIGLTTKKIQKLCITHPSWGESTGDMDSPNQGPIMRRAFSLHILICVCILSYFHPHNHLSPNSPRLMFLFVDCATVNKVYLILSYLTPSWKSPTIDYWLTGIRAPLKMWLCVVKLQQINSLRLSDAFVRQ